MNGTVPTWFMIDGEVWDVRIWGLVSLAAGIIITAFGVGWTVKVCINDELHTKLTIQLNMFLLGMMLFALLSVFIGSGVSPSEWRMEQGFTGYSMENFLYVGGM